MNRAESRPSDFSRSRRGFVTAAIWAPALAASALLSRSGGARAPAPHQAVAAPPPSGYHVSEHIRTYYDLAARY